MAEKAEHGESNSQPETISKEEYERVKSGLVHDLAQARKRASEAEMRAKQLEAEKATLSFNPEDLGESEKALFKKNETLIQRETQLSERERAILERERKLTAKDLAVQHGVDEETLLRCETVEEMKSVAIEAELLNLRKMRAESQQQEETKKARPKYESGRPAPGSKSVFEDTPEEFAQREARLKREAEKVRR